MSPTELILRDPLGERALSAADFPVSVGGPGHTIVLPGAGATIATAKVREANGHLRYVEARRSAKAPTGSFTCYATPQTTIDHSAKAVCEETIFHVAAHAPTDLLARVTRVERQPT